jgi:hypothetical protein
MNRVGESVREGPGGGHTSGPRGLPSLKVLQFCLTATPGKAATTQHVGYRLAAEKAC